MTVNWQRLCLDIRSTGMSMRAVDRKIGVHPDYTAKLARGEIREPKFGDGISLLNLHVDCCGAGKTAALNG